MRIDNNHIAMIYFFHSLVHFGTKERNSYSNQPSHMDPTRYISSEDIRKKNRNISMRVWHILVVSRGPDDHCSNVHFVTEVNADISTRFWAFKIPMKVTKTQFLDLLVPIYKLWNTLYVEVDFNVIYFQWRVSLQIMYVICHREIPLMFMVHLFRNRSTQLS